METIRVSQAQLIQLLEKAAEAHHKHEQETGQPDKNWPEWYAQYIF